MGAEKSASLGQQSSCNVHTDHSKSRLNRIAPLVFPRAFAIVVHSTVKTDPKVSHALITGSISVPTSARHPWPSQYQIGCNVV